MYLLHEDSESLAHKDPAAHNASAAGFYTDQAIAATFTPCRFKAHRPPGCFLRGAGNGSFMARILTSAQTAGTLFKYLYACWLARDRIAPLKRLGFHYFYQESVCHVIE